MVLPGKGYPRRVVPRRQRASSSARAVLTATTATVADPLAKAYPPRLLRPSDADGGMREKLTWRSKLLTRPMPAEGRAGEIAPSCSRIFRVAPAVIDLAMMGTLVDADGDFVAISPAKHCHAGGPLPMRDG